LLFADFDPSVRGIIAQPFLLEADVAGRRRRHVPDYLLLTGSLPIVVDVKPASRVSNPDVASCWRGLGGCRSTQLVVRGVAEPPPVVLANVRLLAGYRRGWLFDAAALMELCEADVDGMPPGAVSLALPHRTPELVSGAALHLLWQQYFLVDLARPLCSTTGLRVAPRAVARCESEWAPDSSTTARSSPSARASLR
jgi:hypothetical protein